MRFNTAPHFTETTYEGASAARLNPEQQLRRSLLSCLLGEDEFDEDGETVMARIQVLADQVPLETLAALAVEARTRFKLRHAPLWLLLALIRRGSGQSLVAEAIAATIQRADEMGELVAMYWRDGKRPLSKQMKLGLGRAFGRFDEYALAKHDRDAKVKIRDVLFLAHPKPRDEAQAALWKRVADRTLVTPDTWEVALSGGADKREAFERLLREKKLGYLALLRNLRNMAEAGVDEGLVRDAIVSRRGGAQRVLPFRYIAAARAAPRFEPALDQALTMAIAEMAPLAGKTVVLVDVSGSMDSRLSARSDMTRADAAAALASIIPGDIRVFSFSNALVEIPPRRGMAGVDAVLESQPHSGTLLGAAVAWVNENVPRDRLIVVTDEQASDLVPPPKAPLAYMINVASARNGVGYAELHRRARTRGGRTAENPRRRSAGGLNFRPIEIGS
jgi:60 kDa SS-A/Ro ribonucleoprotein